MYFEVYMLSHGSPGTDGFANWFPRQQGEIVCTRSSHEAVISTRPHPAHPVSVLSCPCCRVRAVIHPREIQALWSRNDTDTTRQFIAMQQRE